MQEITNWMSSAPVLALIVSALIFVVTLTLVVKRLIGFLITLILLFFTIASGYAILNHQYVSEYLKTYYNKSAQPETNWQEKIQTGFDELKKEFEVQQKNFKDMMEKQQKPQ